MSEVSRSPKGLKLAFVIGGAVLAALLLTLGIVYAVVASYRTPEVAASRFLDRIISGDAGVIFDYLDEAVPLGMLDSGAALGATDTVSTYTILGSATEGDVATVTVEITQGDATYESEIALIRTARDFGLFDVWAIDSDVLPTVAISYARPDGMGLSVGGVEIDDVSFDVEAPVLPGTYVFEPTGTTDFVTAEPVTVTVRLGDSGPTRVDLPVVLTEAGVASAQSAVNATLDACLSQATLTPGPNCGFATTGDDATLTNIRWTLVTRPTVTFGNYQQDAGWPVVSGSPGSMRMDADFTRGDESGTAQSVVDNFVQAGTITTITDDGVASFESVLYE